jgi:hypothetical protein
VYLMKSVTSFLVTGKLSDLNRLGSSGVFALGCVAAYHKSLQHASLSGSKITRRRVGIKLKGE